MAKSCRFGTTGPSWPRALDYYCDEYIMIIFILTIIAIVFVTILTMIIITIIVIGNVRYDYCF